MGNKGTDKYEIVEAVVKTNGFTSDIGDFKKSINYLLEQGYKLVGGVSVISYTINNVLMFKYTQALTYHSSPVGSKPRPKKINHSGELES